MRLFIGLRFPAAALQQIAGLQQAEKNAGVKGTYTPVNNLHCTLAFIGEYDRPEAVIQILQEMDYSPFQLHFEGTGLFKKLFYLKLASSPELNNYVSDLKARLQQANIPMGGKAFFPHVTLIRKADPLDRLIREVPDYTFAACQVVLYLSKRVDNRLTYIPLYIKRAS